MKKQNIISKLPMKYSTKMKDSLCFIYLCSLKFEK